jgi:YegS/Rv2252/BmrU family lipid kinase
LKGKALFIINPISGGKRKDGVPELINKHLDKEKLDPVTLFSDSVAHARQLAREGLGKFDMIVAVGGDGTVNEVASSIVGTGTPLGIIPFGSGNGLSRFLQIPMDTENALKNLTTGHIETIDSASLNGKAFFNMAGVGFDAHIAEVFSHNKKRGFITYIKSAFEEFSKYQPRHYEITIDGKSYPRDAFMISFANSSQYGNNAHISPNASVQDGLLDVCIIKKFSILRLPEMGIRMMLGSAEKTGYVEIIRGKEITITRENSGPIHLDGEPQMAGRELAVKVIPGSLKVIAGKEFKA